MRAPVETVAMVPVPGLAFAIQRKLTVGSSSDPAETEAERVAASVVTALRRRRASDFASDDGATASTTTTFISRLVARQHEHGADCTHDGCTSSGILRHAGHSREHGDHEPIGMAGGDVDRTTESQLANPGSGRPIAEGIRSRLEDAFGADLSGIRLHAGPSARTLNRLMSAQAFTHGSNVYFRDGMPDTNTDAGLHLLAHELTHTVQQGAARLRRSTHQPAAHFASAVGGIRRSTEGPLIQRHAAFEHYMLGQLPPRQLAKIPAVRDAKNNAGQAKNIKNGKGGGLQKQDKTKESLDEVLHLVDMEMARLWRYRKDPEALNGMADQMGKVYKGKAKEGQQDTYGDGPAADHAGPTRDLTDQEYDVPIVVLTCLDGTIVLSYSEMNTMPDLFGNPEAIEKTPKAAVLSLLQGVRQQLYIELGNLRAELDPKGGKKNKLATKTVDDDFQGAQGPRGQAVNEKAYEIRTERQVNVATTRKGEENEQYFAALERNACHFAPASWAQWAGYHDKAIAFATEAAAWRDKAEAELDPTKKQQATEHADKLGNQALIQNSFGEHYLQDSFAAGHLIDKTKIMQWFTLW
ncbi:MAG: eCIS core domain-containing protein, partial [Mycobacterium sp.]